MNPLALQFGDKKIWVTWKPLKVKGRITKIPYAINGRKASSTDENTWSTYKEVKKRTEALGIVFTPEQTLLGIDIDHCLTDNKITHDLKEQIADLILEADTYTEISPSGTGLHLFLNLTAGLPLIANRHEGFEAYTSGRYFTVTENPYGEARPVRTVSPEEAIKILEIIGYPWKKEEAPGVSTKVEPEKDTERVAVSLDDTTLLRKLFASKNGVTIKSLYDGDLSGHDNDASKADMALCSHLAFWSGKNAEQMERLWLASPLGQREKTQKRPDYRIRTIKNAIEQCREVYSVPPEVIAIRDMYETCNLMFLTNDKKDKIYIKNTENITRVLKNHPDFHDRIRYDNFKSVYEIRPPGSDKWRVMEDADGISIQTQIQVLFPPFCTIGKEMVYDAITKVGKDNAIDSAKDWVESLVWDKKPRLDSWLSMTFGTPNDIYHQKVGSNWLKGAVKRIMHPGCKFDYVLVLEGRQGSRKSTSLAVLGGAWHVETTMSTDNKDFFMQFAGKLFVEFSEGETLNRTETKKMKAIITTQFDRYRPPFGRSSQDFPRRCVFAMTTNQEEYLKDETGNRRWLPVRLVKKTADTEWLQENREQLFAEAYHRVINLEETIYEFPEEETEAIQNERRIHDPNADIIAEWYFVKLSDNQRKAGVTVQEAFNYLHGNREAGPVDKVNEMRLTDVFRSVLHLEKLRIMEGRFRKTRWYDSKIPKEEVKVPMTKEEEVEELFKGNW